MIMRKNFWMLNLVTWNVCLKCFKICIIKFTGHHKLACCGNLRVKQSVYQVKREITTELIKYLCQDKIGCHKCLLLFYKWLFHGVKLTRKPIPTE